MALQTRFCPFWIYRFLWNDSYCIKTQFYVFDLFLFILFIYFIYVFISVENLEHCDFIALRDMMIKTHLQDLKDVTNNILYENYRCRKLGGLELNKQQRVLNK